MSEPVINNFEHIVAAVKAFHEHEGSGHDWQHIRRVCATAGRLAREENADLDVVMLIALLHDVDDRKLTGDVNTEKTLPAARRIMTEAGIDAAVIETVLKGIGSIGFHKTLSGNVERSLEAKIVSDADQLDAIGAIGIARTFVYGAFKSRQMFDPDEIPMETFTKEQYAANNGSTVAHFFEKLLKLHTMMHTNAGRREGQTRHNMMVDYLDAFFREVDASEEWKLRLEKYRMPRDEPSYVFEDFSEARSMAI
ncbi:HD domain-containing protein [Rhizobium sp. MHM7A]|uniref:HD domain-containing protein n=1 Tax=Rhizobium sp. MHM7A TaxID=2583233 RepID=UPI001105E7BD|nr:HD domain-containing protein [Rhizobium sp. MHM7A]TLX16390.1 HD domain-containing protein [Rhizobium sp. MHM7A]